MKRDIQALQDKEFDLVVVGAGVHGACVARDAALRGMSVALLDKGDICGATSHNSLKTIHGGIRYLQHLNFFRTWASIREQAYWLKTAPERVKPIPFMMPTYGHGMRGPLAMFVGIMLYAFVGLGRNIGLDPKSKIKMGRIISAKECQRLAKGIPAEGLSGAAIWYDAQVEDADQTVLEITEHASQHGTVVANHVEVIDFLIDDKTVIGVEAKDKSSGATIRIKSRCVVNATGPWLSQQLAQSTLTKSIPMNLPLVKRMNIVTKRRINDHALSFYSQHDSDSVLGNTKRLYFVVPWKDYSMFGTTHFPYPIKKSELDETASNEIQSSAERTEIEAFVDEINTGYPGLDLHIDDVLYCYQGLGPADAMDDAESSNPLHESKVIDHTPSDGIEGLVSIVSIKWTTARRVAEQCTDVVAKKLENTQACMTRHSMIPALACERALAHLNNGDLVEHCKAHINTSMPLTLADFLLRRTDDFITNRLSIRQLALILNPFTSHFEWSHQQQRKELDDLRTAYFSPEVNKVIQQVYETIK